ncbi:hypothetical protein ATK78_2991 [Pedobacter metabolipauper]|uniref:Uncharacterized protein n=1 Tax=Pedobacter metabolipauper TaxID=425513 RepID=A0A4R6ST38_9SPHI|nr:hypothetical protein ATK78_2991 [Pedobacter metabolipauper]
MVTWKKRSWLRLRPEPAEVQLDRNNKFATIDQTV